MPTVHSTSRRQVPSLCCYHLPLQLLLLLCSVIQFPYPVWSLQTTNSSKGSSQFVPPIDGGAICPTVSSSANAPTASINLLQKDKLLRAIQSGRVYQQEDFLTEEQVLYLLQEIDQLERDGQFVTKGLSNTAKKKQTQGFSARQDRSVCVVPWFVQALLPATTGPTTITTESLEENRSDRCNHGDDDEKTVPAVNWDSPDAIPTKVRQLQYELSTLLQRDSIADPTMDHECYYSQSKVGSFLPRHMDERHEELKGANGWLQHSRRSISWLVYLSEPHDWDINTNGGALRTFPQPVALLENVGRGSTHDGNLQIGWLFSEDSNKRNGATIRQPVYLDSWFKPPISPGSDSTSSKLVPEPHCVLYVVDDDITKQPQEGRKYLTRSWLTETLHGMSVPDFLKACAVQDSTYHGASDLLLFQTSDYARRFHLIEDRAEWNEGRDPIGSEIHDVSPIRGSLVVFDSVQLPHEVREIKSGTRRALAGWFHERTQQFPTDWYA